MFMLILKKRLFFLLSIFIITFGLEITVSGELLLKGEDNLGYNLVYDTDLDITWYDYSFLAPNYQDAVIWADQLSVEVGSVKFTDWRLPAFTHGVNNNSSLPRLSELEHLYLTELVHSEVLHPWAFPNRWRDFENLLGGYYWMRRPEGQNGMGSNKDMKAPAYNSYDQKVEFTPVTGTNRILTIHHTFFYKKNLYLGVAVHNGDIMGNLQKQSKNLF